MKDVDLILVLLFFLLILVFIYYMFFWISTPPDPLWFVKKYPRKKSKEILMTQISAMDESGTHSDQPGPSKVVGTPTIVGGLSKPSNVDAKVNGIANMMKDKIEEDLKTKLDTFTPLTYATQVVSGLVYYIKIEVNPCLDTNQKVVDCTKGTNYIDAKIYMDLKGNPSLLGIKTGVKKDDPISYF